MPTYSEIDITFLDAFEPNTNTNGVAIGYSDFGTQSSNVLTSTIVTTRANSFEFSTGTDANTQAQFYKDAFDLDYVPSGDWECTISGDTVTVKSTNPNVEFNQLFAGAPNDQRVIFTLNNVANEIPQTEGLLKARSNYYLNIPVTDEDRQDVFMYFRQGDITLPFSAVDYTKRVLITSDNTTDLDILISRFALDYLEPTPVFSAIDGNIVNSNEGSIIATTITTKNEDQAQEQERIKNLVTTRGYSKYLEGANDLDNPEILLSSKITSVNKDGILMIPIFNTGQTVVVKDDAGNDVFNDLLITTDFIEDSIVYLFIDVSQYDTKYFIIQDEYIVKVVDECKYTPQDVYFLNRYGVFENLTFFKAKRESVNFNKEGEYKNNFVSGGTYNTSRHLYRQGNINGRTSIIMNTGYIDESQNETIEQLVNSEYVYFNNSGTFIPVNIDKTNIDLLTSLNDKLINYAIEFKYSFDIVQNV